MTSDQNAVTDKKFTAIKCIHLFLCHFKDIAPGLNPGLFFYLQVWNDDVCKKEEQDINCIQFQECKIEKIFLIIKILEQSIFSID